MCRCLRSAGFCCWQCGSLCQSSIIRCRSTSLTLLLISACALSLISLSIAPLFPDFVHQCVYEVLIGFEWGARQRTQSSTPTKIWAPFAPLSTAGVSEWTQCLWPPVRFFVTTFSAGNGDFMVFVMAESIQPDLAKLRGCLVSGLDPFNWDYTEKALRSTTYGLVPWVVTSLCVNWWIRLTMSWLSHSSRINVSAHIPDMAMHSRSFDIFD